MFCSCNWSNNQCTSATFLCNILSWVLRREFLPKFCILYIKSSNIAMLHQLAQCSFITVCFFWSCQQFLTEQFPSFFFSIMKVLFNDLKGQCKFSNSTIPVGSYESKFATRLDYLVQNSPPPPPSFVPSANCPDQTVNQNNNVAAKA